MQWLIRSQQDCKKIIDDYSRNHPIQFRLTIYFSLLLIFLGLWIISNMVFSPVVTNINAARYLLSALVQSQAAIITIIITVSFVLIQLTSSTYTPKIIEIYIKRPSIWIVLAFYLISISYGFYVLKILPGDAGSLSLQDEWLVSLAFWLGLFTVFSLVPYLVDIIYLLKPRTIFDHLTHEISLDNISADTDNPMQSIFDVILVSIKRYDVMTTRSALDAVYEKVIEICDSLDISWDESGNTGKIRAITHDYARHLLRCGNLAVEIRDTELTTEVSSNLDKFGIYIVTRKIDAPTEYLSEEPVLVINALTDLANACAAAGMDQATASICDSIGAIIDKAFERDDERLPGIGALRLKRIGINAARYDDRLALTGIIHTLTYFSSTSMEKKYHSGGQPALLALLDVGVAASEYHLKRYMNDAADAFRRLAAIQGTGITLQMLRIVQDEYPDNPHFAAFLRRYDPTLTLPITIEDVMRANTGEL